MDDFSYTKVDPNNLQSTLKYIGAVDVSYSLSDKRKAVAALIITEYPSMDVVYEDFYYEE